MTDVTPMRERCRSLPAADIAEIAGRPTSDRGAAHYAKTYCVTLAEANRRAELRRRDATPPRTEPGPPPPPPPDSIGALMAALPVREGATFAGLWLEHSPTYRVVVAFTRNAAATLAKYTRDPLFVPLDRPGPTLAELRATQARLWDELVAIKARPAGTSSNERIGRVEIMLAVEPNVVRAAEQAGRISLPGYVDLIAPPPLTIAVPPPRAGDARLRAFPRAYYQRSGVSTLGPGPGTIVLREGCLRIVTNAGDRTVLWPNEGAADLSRPDRIAIVDRANGNRVEVGEQIAVEGAAMPPGWNEPVMDADPACPPPYTFVTSFEPWDGFRERMLEVRAEALAREQGITPAEALKRLRAQAALTARLAALSDRLRAAAGDRFGGYVADDGRATLYLVGGTDAGVLRRAPADLRSLIAIEAVPRSQAALTTEHERLANDLQRVRIGGRTGYDLRTGRVSLGEVDDLAALAQAVRDGRLVLPATLDLYSDGAMPIGGYAQERGEAADRAAEAAPDFAAIRALIEATPVPTAPAPNDETRPLRRPNRAQSLEAARHLVDLGFSAADIRRLQAVGADPVVAWYRQNGLSTPASRAILAREVVVAEPVRIHDDARLGDGYRSTVVLRVIEPLKGGGRAGDMVTMRFVSGREPDRRYVQANDEPPLLDGLPGAMRPGTRWLLHLAVGYARNATLHGGKPANPPSRRWYAPWFGVAPVVGDRVLPTRFDDRSYDLNDLRRELAPVDAAFARLPGRTPERFDPPALDAAARARARPLTGGASTDAGLSAEELDFVFALAARQVAPLSGHRAVCLGLQPTRGAALRDVPADLVERIGATLGLPAHPASACDFDSYPFVRATEDLAILYSVAVQSREKDGTLIVLAGAMVGNLGAKSLEYRIARRNGVLHAEETGLMVVS